MKAVCLGNKNDFLANFCVGTDMISVSTNDYTSRLFRIIQNFEKEN